MAAEVTTLISQKFLPMSDRDEVGDGSVDIMLLLMLAWLVGGLVAISSLIPVYWYGISASVGGRDFIAVLLGTAATALSVALSSRVRAADYLRWTSGILVALIAATATRFGLREDDGFVILTALDRAIILSVVIASLFSGILVLILGMRGECSPPRDKLIGSYLLGVVGVLLTAQRLTLTAIAAWLAALVMLAGLVNLFRKGASSLDGAALMVPGVIVSLYFFVRFDIGDSEAVQFMSLSVAFAVVCGLAGAVAKVLATGSVVVLFFTPALLVYAV